MQHVLIKLFIMYSIIDRPTLYTLYICSPSVDAVKQEANHVTSTVT